MTSIGAGRMRIVVIGAGSCGSVLAARCAAHPDVDVVLVEAGPARADRGMPIGRLPIGPGSDLIDPIPVRIDGVPGGLARGRVVGGSGAVNGGYFVRARTSDIARWPQPLWSPSTVSRTFRAIESDLDLAERPMHGADGPIPVSRVPVERYGAVARRARSVLAGLGMPEREDLNDSDIEAGFGSAPGNVRDDLRIDSAAAYLGSISEGGREAGRPIDLRVETTACRIRVANGRARGVLVRTADHAIEEIPADLIVLSAGAVRTPHLLMMSGIGPAAVLAGAGIRPMVDLPGVGVGLRDHPEILIPTDDLSIAPGSRLLELIAHLDDVELRLYTAGFGAFIPGIAAPRRYIGVALMRGATTGRLVLDPVDPTATPTLEYTLGPDRDRLHAIGAGRTPAGEVAQALAAVASREGADRPPAVIGMSTHACCGARMGADDDPDAVVDERCRVRGVEGLAVVDTSAFPEIPSRGPHATAIMLAHRAADLLWADG